MKRRTQTRSDSANPAVVVAAFAPDTEYVLSLDGWILLEALGSPFTRQEAPGSRDVVLAALVMTDEDALLAARRNNTLEKLLATATAGKRPADILPLIPKLTAAINAAFEPASGGGTSGEKKKLSGVGWWLTLVDVLASEYGWPPATIRRLPLAEIFCYHAAIMERHEVDTGPSYAEREIIANLKL